MKTQTFLIRCEYPDGDRIPTQEFVENIQEYLAANIMDGEKGRLVVKPVYMTDKEIDRIIKANIHMAGFMSLVKRMREAQKKVVGYSPLRIENYRADWEKALDYKTYLEREVDEYLEKWR